ncbi:MAG: ATP-grasp domain-containing protein [Methylicorpusculum sp.]|uniref:ATP-grasp domain-containing protein n=1 Tax=Methylicorpusculum sp. TaxID=2713644 RepID=UPI002727DA17|nr:ATP-grasp domain-containing protein [Methylicorpusculum sp.]MDO8846324.1 ATP-grasp domain-containing protein [Methylicorpusculum sp.]MDO8938247.1 ATP-grasp domain-containing protein [Methylicorpusculum sp.]MDP2177044.1 ATP-grasp domain-containing protein [Methylicorpusculum sp.]MDP2203726.1 ATP-grasp domain-containing protein [Methylicorpusculum sp.]MDP3529922.1 ATP-grasp domain-containing protein [Methylicorpusculum sp.]
MKLLVFEYITGGGCCSELVPEHLVNEGLLMLTALLRDLAELDDVQVTVMLDARILNSISFDFTRFRTVPVYAEPDWIALMEMLLPSCDAVWPVAPEINNTLLNLTQRINAHGKILLSSSEQAVALTANKFNTWEILAAHGIKAVPTERYHSEHLAKPGRFVVKPIDGMGCETTYLIDNGILSFELVSPERYIIQPYVEGRTISFSCLFGYGNARLICVNTQVIAIDGGLFKLVKCLVNSDVQTSEHQELVGRIAKAFPGLWGYVGIDLIEHDSQLYVLEINPRLTSSYAGIYDALGLNIAGAVIQMNEKIPELVAINDKTVTVPISRVANGN